MGTVGEEVRKTKGLVAFFFFTCPRLKKTYRAQQLGQPHGRLQRRRRVKRRTRGEKTAPRSPQCARGRCSRRGEKTCRPGNTGGTASWGAWRRGRTLARHGPGALAGGRTKKKKKKNGGCHAFYTLERQRGKKKVPCRGRPSSPPSVCPSPSATRPQWPPCPPPPPWPWARPGRPTWPRRLSACRPRCASWGTRWRPCSAVSLFLFGWWDSVDGFFEAGGGVAVGEKTRAGGRPRCGRWQLKRAGLQKPPPGATFRAACPPSRACDG